MFNPKIKYIVYIFRVCMIYDMYGRISQKAYPMSHVKTKRKNTFCMKNVKPVFRTIYTFIVL